MSKYVKRVEAFGIHDRFDLVQEFQQGVDIIHGRNGAGKTTLLHILANMLNGDFRRFIHLKFRKISIDIVDTDSSSSSNYAIQRTRERGSTQIRVFVMEPN